MTHDKTTQTHNHGPNRGDGALLDASADGLGGGAADVVHAVGAVVLLVVQEPARVGEATHLDGGVAQPLQKVGHAVHVQQDPGAPRTRPRRTGRLGRRCHTNTNATQTQSTHGRNSGGRAG